MEVLLPTRPCIVFLLFAVLQAPAQQPAAAGSPPPDALAVAQAELRAAESAHPGNTVELARALDKLNSEELNQEKVVPETLDRARRELAIADAAAGQHSQVYLRALTTLAHVTVRTSHPAEARTLAEQALELAQKEFPNTVDLANAAEALGEACKVLGDEPAALKAFTIAVDLDRALGDKLALSDSLGSRGNTRDHLGDPAGGAADLEESLKLAVEAGMDQFNLGILHNNIGAHYAHYQQFPQAVEHYTRAVEIVTKAAGPDAPLLANFWGNLGDLYMRMGQFPLSWKNYDLAILHNIHESIEWQAATLTGYGRSLAAGGNLRASIDKGLIANRMSRETFVLQARTLPERQALAYSRRRANGLEVALSVIAHHPDRMSNDIYEEVVRSRALVADEMARRQKNLNKSNDPEVAHLLEEENAARTAVLDAEHDTSGSAARQDNIAAATARLEKIERTLAERSAALRADERNTAVNLEELRRSLPPHSALVSYVAYDQSAVEYADPARKFTPSAIAFVLRADSDRIRVFDLGPLQPLGDLIRKMRASADTEAHNRGLDSTRNEHAYRDAGLALRQHIWDPLQADLKDTQVILIVPDDVLNLVPFSALPAATGSANGYLVESGPVLHMLTSERDLLRSDPGVKKAGLLAVGGPAFDQKQSEQAAARPANTLRQAALSCDDFTKAHFDPLPAASLEAGEISASWRRWYSSETSDLLTGDQATRDRFLQEAGRHRILHVATHAFVLNKACGNGNPLLHSGLVFAGANQDRNGSIVTAQQIASLDLSGVDWAVLSACNTGGGELHDGEGVLGLERAFRVAGVRTVVMTLWPIDDEIARGYMRALYTERFQRHTGTAAATWNTSRKLLLQRRAAGQSTHPWYWAGFVAAGDWR